MFCVLVCGVVHNSFKSYPIISQSNQAAAALVLYFCIIAFQCFTLALYMAFVASSIDFLFSGVSFCHLPITLSNFTSRFCLKFNALCNKATSHSLTVAHGSIIFWKAFISDTSLNQSLFKSSHIKANTVSA